MTAQQTQPAPTATGTETAESAVEFRVSRSGMPRRRLRLVGPRYVFGSGPDCSIRLDDPSVRPMHAVLTRDAEGVLLRAYGAPISVNGHPATEAALELGDHFQLGQYDFELIATFPPLDPTVPSDASLDSPVASREPVSSADQPTQRSVAASQSPEPPSAQIHSADDGQPATPAAEPPRSADPVAESPCVTASETDSEEGVDRRRRVAFADSMRIVRESPRAGASFVAKDQPAGGAAAALPSTAARFETQAMLDHLALLADERRRQEQNKRQIARYRRREERQRKQLQSLRAAQAAAEQRARKAEESVHEVRGQLDALAERVTMLAKTAMPGIEDRLQQQQQESLVTSRQYNELIETLRQRLDTVQDAVDAVQGETREIRQQTASVREDQQEVLSNAEQLEQMIQLLSESRDADRAGQASELDEMRETLRQMSLKLSHTSSQLDETRQSSQGLSTLVQQLRASLVNMQNDSQRFATIERIDSVERQLRVTDVRLNELCQEFDAQTVQLQQECETLRQRLEDAEDSAAQFAHLAAQPAAQPAAPARTSGESPIATLTPIATPIDAPATSERAASESALEAPESTGIDESAGYDDSTSYDESTGIDQSTGIDESVGYDGSNSYREPVELAASANADEMFAADGPVAAEGRPDVEVDADDELPPPQWQVDPVARAAFSAEEEPSVDLQIPSAEVEDAAPEWSSSPSPAISPWATAGGGEARDASDDADDSMTYVRTAQLPEEDSADPQFESAFQPEQTYRMEPTTEIEREREQEFASDEAIGATMPFRLTDSEQPSDDDSCDAAEDAQPFASASPTGCRSAAEILASMGLAYEEEDEPVEATQLGSHWSAAAAAPEAAAPQKPAASADAGTEDEDDDSIEAYMNRLLKRVQGGSGSSPSTSQTAADMRPITHTVEPTPVRESAATETSASPVVEVAKVPDNTPYVPRSQAPERSSGLAAMRELANNSARLAIAHSVRQRMVHEKVFKYSLFAMGLVAGFAALIGSGFQMDRWFIVACCCFGLSIFFLVEGLSLAHRLRQAEAAPAPIDAELQ